MLSEIFSLSNLIPRSQNPAAVAIAGQLCVPLLSPTLVMHILFSKVGESEFDMHHRQDGSRQVRRQHVVVLYIYTTQLVIV